MSAASDDFIATVTANAPADDAALAELIEADARGRLERGEPVNLERYLAAIPDLRQRRDALDTAIDMTLRSLSQGSQVTSRGIDEFIRRCPDLATTIREVAVLNSMVWATSGLRPASAEHHEMPVKPLPCEFGPAMLPSILEPGHAPARRYELQQLLGKGGYGQVYLALDRQLSEEGHTAMVAIKILATDDLAASERARLIEEATKVRRINHPNVVMVLDRGVTEQDEDYIVYEFVDGGDLTTLVHQRPLLPVREIAALMMKIADGVHAAHSAGVIHCDLKPSNIMLTAGREPKVGDFGIAVRAEPTARREPPLRATTRNVPIQAKNGLEISQRPIGTVGFISPEQFRMEDGGFSIPSDVYALGGIFYLLLSGQPPNGSTPDEIACNHDVQHGRKEPPAVRTIRSEVDCDLEAICRRSMAVRIGDRYNSAAAFADDLKHWLNREPIGWTRPGIGRVVHLWSRRKPALAASLGLIAALLVTGSVVALRLSALANEHALRAHIAKLNADWEQESRLKSKAIAENSVNALRATLGNYRFATEALAKIWAFEYMFGPKVLGLPDHSPDLWKNRIHNIRHLVETARQQGRGDEFETILWESALGFWLVNDKDYIEAEPLLAANLEAWSRMLSPGDPWLNDLRSMIACASMNRLMAQARSMDDAPSSRNDLTAEARRMEAVLVAACDHMPEGHRGTPMHYLLLNTLADVYGPDLLNQPDRRDATAASIKALLAAKPKQRTNRTCAAGR